MKKILILFISLTFLFSCFSSSKKGVVKQGSSSAGNSEEEAKIILLDGFESDDNWCADSGSGTIIDTKTVEGKTGKAVEISYDLADTKQWVAINNFFTLDVSKGGTFKFWIKGTGAVNNIEFKLVDIDQSSFIREYRRITKCSKWLQIVIPVKSLHYAWGGDNKLDMVNQIWICITTHHGKKGTLVIDHLEFVE